MSLIDLGMSGSVARLLIDHKDDRASGTYGGLIQTGWLVLAVQGLIVWLAGFGLAPLLSKLLAISPGLQSEFIALMRWQTTTWALSFVVRIFGHLLQSHQRMDLINYNQIAMLGLGFVLLWFFFHAGQGVFSLAWAGLIGAGCSAAVLVLTCWRLGLFPAAGEWGRPSWRYFRELFGYGKDLFLVGVGTQLIMASQTMIITRRLGLETAAIWAIGTRMFTLVSQVIWRIFDVSAPALAEMIVRRETKLLRERYQTLVILSASLSGFAAVAYALCNQSFVEVWVGIAWPSGNDALLGFWMIVMAVLHCHVCFMMNAKQIGSLPYVLFVEGWVFVTAAILATHWGGLPAIIACSVICSTLFSGAYGVWRVSEYFELPVREVAWRWLAPARRVLFLFAPAGLGAWCGLQWVDNPMLRLAAGVLLSGSLGFYLLLRYGLSQPVQSELLERAPKGINPLLRRVFTVCAQ
jgi:O-antigen/teichoic acid export membrane protein